MHRARRVQTNQDRTGELRHVTARDFSGLLQSFLDLLGKSVVCIQICREKLVWKLPRSSNLIGGGNSTRHVIDHFSRRIRGTATEYVRNSAADAESSVFTEASLSHRWNARCRLYDRLLRPN